MNKPGRSPIAEMRTIMLIKFSSQYRQIIHEFLRYALVGGAAYILDFSMLYLSRTLFFYRMGHNGILLATALGFTSGLILNYVFSLRFVFKKIDEKAQRHKIRSFILFVIIGLAGLLITEFCMYTGIILFGETQYLVVKIFTAGIVLLWNYLTRKIFIFKGAGYAHG
jgi:putative flippase GtrA